MLLSISLIFLTLTSSFVHFAEAEDDSNEECNTSGLSKAAVEAVQNIVGHASLLTCPDHTADLSEFVKLILVKGDREKEVSLLDKITIEEIRNAPMYAMVVHGYLDSPKSGWMHEIAKGQNNKMGPSAVTILVDYSAIAYCDYISVVNRLEPIAKHLSIGLNTINSTGKLFCTGHSIGAHVCGMIGAHLQKKISLIVGLDPAGPLFPKDKQNRLRPDSAETVQVMHTDSLVLGTTLTLGTVDFHMNHDSIGQPFCIGSICAHWKAIDYWHSVLNDHYQRNCPSLQGDKGEICRPGFLTDLSKCTGPHSCEMVSKCYR